MLNGVFVTRQASRVAFTFVVVSAIAITCVTVYGLVAGVTWFEGLFVLGGVLALIWAILFSLFEVRRIADRSKSIGGEMTGPDPDRARTVSVGPPSGHPYPHHEQIEGSMGLDQGQLTSRSPDLPPISDLLNWRRKNKS